MAVSTREANVLPEDIARNQPHKELCKQQAQIAMYLEIGYLSVSKFPELSSEIRLTAHGARSLHKMTVGLMKKYYGASVHVIDTMIPLIVDAVELEDGEIIEEAYGQIIQMASEMKKEAEDTKMRYYAVQTDIQRNIGSVEKTGKGESVKAKKKEVELEREQARREELENEKKKLDDEVKRRQEKLERYREQTEAATKSKDEADQAVAESGMELLANVLIIPLAIASGGLPVIAQAAKAGTSFLKIFSSIKQANKESQKLQEQMDKKRQNKEKMRKKEQELKQIAIEERETLRKIKALALEDTECKGNVESLQEALVVLGNVDKQLSKIADFWEDVVVVVTYISNQTEAGKVFVKKIKERKYAERFIQRIDAAKESWELFREMCGEYVAVCGKDPELAIDSLYAFLSLPLTKMPKQAKTDRKQLLFDRIESHIPTIME